MPETDIVEHLCKVKHEAMRPFAIHADNWPDWEDLPEEQKAPSRAVVKAILDDVAPRFLELAIDEIQSEQRWQVELSGRPLMPRLGQQGERTHRYTMNRLGVVVTCLRTIWMAPFDQKEEVGTDVRT